MSRSKLSILALLGTIAASSTVNAQAESWGERLSAARGAEYQSLREAISALPADERARLRLEAEGLAPEYFERAGLLLGALVEFDQREACKARVYNLRGLDAERAMQRRRKDPEAASHLRLAVRSGCEALVLELALRPELYELEVARSLSPDQRAALDRGLVIALGGAKSPVVIGYLGSRTDDPKGSLWLRRRALEAFGRVAGMSGTSRLRAVLEDGRQPAELRAGALVGLGFGGDPAALPSIQANLRAAEPAIAAAALVGLSSLAAESASEALRAQVSRLLVGLLAEVSADQTRGVIDALAYVAHPQALEALAQVREKSEDGRFEAAERRVRRALSRSGARAELPVGPGRPGAPDKAPLPR